MLPTCMIYGLPLLVHRISIPMISITTKPNIAQSVHMYPGAYSGDRDYRSWEYRRQSSEFTHDLYTHCLYPHNAECIETQLILMYHGIIIQGAAPSRILIKNSVKLHAGSTSDRGGKGHCPHPPGNLWRQFQWGEFLPQEGIADINIVMLLFGLRVRHRYYLRLYHDITSKATCCQLVNPEPLLFTPIPTQYFDVLNVSIYGRVHSSAHMWYQSNFENFIWPIPQFLSKFLNILK